MALAKTVKGIGRIWRSAVTAMCFIAFGIGGTILSALLFPLLMIVPGHRRQRQARARAVVGFCFRLLVLVLEKSGCMVLKTSGIEKLQTTRGALVLANHPSYIDVVVLLSLLPQASCVVKAAHWRNPFYWSIVRSAGYINNTSPEAILLSCAETLASGQSLVVFPEGTRTVPGEPPRFLRGAAHIALKAETTLLPVLISCNPPTLTKGEPWWRAPERPFTFLVTVQNPVSVDFFVPDPENSPIGARRFTRALQQHFCHELESYGYA